MEIGKTFYAKTPAQWRKWLEKNHAKAKEIWLVFHSKASGNKGITYSEALDEALCFGWIDSIVKKLDEHSRVQRFTPRRTGSPMSPVNKERVRRLVKAGKMTDAGLAHAGNLELKFKIPDNILKELKKNKIAWKNFKKFPEYYKHIRAEYVQHYYKRMPEMYKKSLAYLIKMSEKNKMYGTLK